MLVDERWIDVPEETLQYRALLDDARRDRGWPLVRFCPYATQCRRCRARLHDAMCDPAASGCVDPGRVAWCVRTVIRMPRSLGRRVWNWGWPKRPQEKCCGGNPKTDDHRRCHSADRALGSPLRLRAELRHERTGDHPDHESDGDRQEDQLVKVAEDGDEVRNRIDGAERIGGNGRCRQLHMPRHTRVSRGDVEGHDVLLDRSGPSAQPGEASWPIPVIVHGWATAPVPDSRWPLARDHRHTLGAGGFADSIDAAPVLPRAMSRCKASRGNQPVQLKRVHAEAARPLLQGGGVLRLSETQYERLRLFAFERRLSHQDIIESALLGYLDQQERSA